MKNFAFAWLCLSLFCAPSWAQPAKPAAPGREAAIDFERARALLQKAQKGGKLSPEEAEDLAKARQARRGQ